MKKDCLLIGVSLLVLVSCASNNVVSSDNTNYNAQQSVRSSSDGVVIKECGPKNNKDLAAFNDAITCFADSVKKCLPASYHVSYGGGNVDVFDIQGLKGDTCMMHYRLFSSSPKLGITYDNGKSNDPERTCGFPMSNLLQYLNLHPNSDPSMVLAVVETGYLFDKRVCK